MIQLHDEGNPVRVLARHGAEHAERRSDRVAPALDRQLHDVRRVEVRRIGRERGAGRVLDSLVDGENRDVARTAEAPVVDQRLQGTEHARRAVRQREAAVDEVRTGQVQVPLRNRLALVLEKRRLVSQDGFDPADVCRCSGHVMLLRN